MTEYVYNMLVDSASTAGYTYYGEALPGVAQTSPQWRIFRKDSSGNILYASPRFDQKWSARTGLTYS